MRQTEGAGSIKGLELVWETNRTRKNKQLGVIPGFNERVPLDSTTKQIPAQKSPERN